jgi:CheY-like chemotaxis protein
LARKILLADDSVTAQNMGRRILSDAGYDVSTVNNGSAALKRIAESKPDLIVLDVYMPGYGGLEVCQRLRESPETARIPVLLTVGKLEPFKADEARRVRADGFIVKPFEASELLTALTKLEDKIVPQSQPAKPGRFAKAWAAADESTPSKEFGDSETGWKNRLSIPPPHAKHREPAPEEPSATIASLRESVKPEEVKPAEAKLQETKPEEIKSEEAKSEQIKSGIEEALLSSMPQDVTAEEIAAIKAAAAAFSAPSEDSVFSPRPARGPVEAPAGAQVVASQDSETHSVQSQEPASESTANAEPAAAAVTFAAGSQEAAPAENSIAAPENAAVPVKDEIAEPALPEAVATASGSTVSEEAPTSAPPDAVAEVAKLGDEEVSAALASLAPANGHGDSATGYQDAAVPDREQIAVTVAATAATQQFNGPRWVAEPVALLDDEATLALEQEMERAYTAFAAADAARMSFAEAPAGAVEAAGNSGSQAESVSPALESISQPEAAAQPESTAVAHDDTNPPATIPAEDPAPEPVENAAYAAAASSSPNAETTMIAEAISQRGPRNESFENAAPTSDGHQSEPELAAAWANWRQIRDSVIGSQLTSQIANTVAGQQETQEAQPIPEAESQPEAAADDSSEISNIVDSVLADLKPKLMAEIAKKISKEKNDKKK